MARYIVLIFLNVFAFSGNAYADDPAPVFHRHHEADFWPSTGINFSYLKSHALNDCYKTQTELMACYQLVNAVAATLTPEARFASANEAASDPVYFSRLVHEYPGGVNLYTVSGMDQVTSDYQGWMWQKKINYTRLQTVLKMSLASDSDRIDFAALLDSLHTLVSDEALVSGHAYNAYLAAAFDPHTYAVPKQEKDYLTAHGNEHRGSGLGIRYARIGGKIKIIDVSLGGPSDKEGLLVNDVIEAVNNTDVSDKSAVETSALIHEQSDVTFRIQRQERVFNVTIEKKPYSFVNVDSKIVDETGARYGFIKVRNFVDDKVSGDVQKILSEFENQKVKGIILDLRGNRGGYIENAVRVTSLFVGQKVIVQSLKIGDRDPKIVRGDIEAVTQLPLVTLVDGVTMSAAEIVAMALQDHRRSWIVGDLTYGKGSAQAETEPTPGLLLYKTDEYYYGPSGRSILGTSLIPDFSVKPFLTATAEDQFTPRERDLLLNFHPSKTGQWVQPRAQTVAQIEDCVAHNESQGADLRLLRAQEVLSCYQP